MLGTFVKKFLREEMKWSLRHATHPGKKTPENITQILTNAALCLVWTISEHGVLRFFLVNTDQTGVQYSAGGFATWAPIGSKQVEVIGKDEWWTFTLVVGIFMSGEVLPEELKFHFEHSGNDTY
jgi:hypothetical protein